MNIEQIGRVVVIAAIVLLIAGALMILGGKLGLGRLPGDFVFRRGNFTVYFPLLTSLILSALLTLVFYFLRR
jgi:hypothetical protein